MQASIECVNSASLNARGKSGIDRSSHRYGHASVPLYGTATPVSRQAQ